MKIRTLLVMLLVSSFIFAQEGKVNFIIGQVQVMLPGQSTWAKAMMGQSLATRSRVKTEKESRCEILLADGSVIKVLENSEVEMKKIGKEGDEETSIFSPFGELFFKVKKMFSHNFKLETPVAVMAVRGTEFYVINSPRGNGLWVKDGVVDFGSPGGGPMISVPAGQKSTLITGGTPAPPQALSTVEKKLMDEMAVTNPQFTPPPPAPEKPEEGLRDTGEKGGEVSAGPGVKVKTPQKDAEEEKEGSGDGGSGITTGVNVGATTFDGQMMTQIGLRPEFTLGKLGIGLDLTFYMDNAGNVSDKNWNSTEDIIHKFMYIRWGQRGDSFFAKLGALSDYSLGFGMLVNRYNNVILYPDRIKTGMVVGIQTEDIGAEVMLNDWAETFNQGGVYSARLTYNLFAGLKIGGSIVYDHNQYKSLQDDDNDDVPNVVDDFPNDPNNYVDTDGDGIPDDIDPDRDGNGYTDNSQDTMIPNNDTYFDSTKLKIPFFTNQIEDKSQMAYSVDISYPLINTSLLAMTVYSDYSQFLTDDKGYGITAPGIVGKIGFMDFKAAYRIISAHFIPEYFNTTYEVERIVAGIDSTGKTILVTKREGLKYINDGYQGYLVGAGFNLFDILRFSAEYQDMKKSDFNYKTLRGNIDINTDFIPKISQAGGYYYDMNVEKLFEKNPGTIFGLKFGYEISQGANMIVDIRETYKDLNGDGRISGDAEIFRTTYISTVFTF